MTMIVASIMVDPRPDVAATLEDARRAVAAGARLIEWRVDAIGHDQAGVRAAAALVEQSPAPCIVTRRPEREGGRCAEPDAARAAFLVDLINAAKPKYLDIELDALRRDRAPWQELLDLAGEDVSIILSAHDFTTRPGDLMQRVELMSDDAAGDVVKIAWQARSLRDNLEAFDLLAERSRPMVALCMGRFGLMSRALAPKFGGLLTYACANHADATAPGQPTIDELRATYRFDSIGAETKVYGVIGWPVEHSLGPAIHNAGFEAAGQNGVYLPLPVPPEYEHFKATVGSMIDHPRLDFRGASVTIPHKENLLRFVAERGGRSDALTEKIGAANTLIVGSAGALSCANTDCPGAIDALCDGMGIEPSGLRELRAAVLGAGGVARAVVAGLLDAGAAVVVFGRTRARAEALVESFGGDEGAAIVGRVEVGASDAIAAGGFDLYINCTPVGMAGGPAADESPLPDDVPLDDKVTVFDTVYVPVRTPLVRQAEARGARVVTGMEMFLRQAALQFERWTGKAMEVEVARRVVGGS